MGVSECLYGPTTAVTDCLSYSNKPIFLAPKHWGAQVLWELIRRIRCDKNESSYVKQLAQVTQRNYDPDLNYHNYKVIPSPALPD